MFGHATRITTLVLTVCGLAMAASSTHADEALDQAFEALNTYDWGSDRSALKPIDDAVAAAAKDPAALKALEQQLASSVRGDISQAAKDFCCRQLSLVGSATCVESLAPLLEDQQLSHMARYALERIPDDAALATMRDALPKVSGQLKVGVINSLGARRDEAATDALLELLNDSDVQIAGAAAAALGEIGTPEAAKALSAMQSKAPTELQLTTADACLACAEHLLADGDKTQATLLYARLAKSDIKQVKLAAVRGMLAATTAK